MFITLPPVQLNPVYIVQVEEQPSPFTIFPSSQASDPTLLLSPQVALQTDRVPVQV